MGEIYGYINKNTLPDNWDIFKPAFQAIIDIHNFGNSKYGKYSWMNEPKNTCATLTSSIGSIVNHTTLIFTGQMIDLETGELHYKHLLTRCQMGLEKLYSLAHPGVFDNYIKDTSELSKSPPINKLSTLNNPTLDLDQIHVCSIISAMKYKSIYEDYSENALKILLQTLILEALIESKQNDYDPDIWNTIFALDQVFWIVSLLYKKHLESL